MSAASNPKYNDIYESARQEITELDSLHFSQRMAAPNTIIIDVREPSEWVDGVIENANLIPRGILERESSKSFTNLDCEILIYCATGKRSAIAAQTMQHMGYSNVSSLEQGFEGWRSENLPIAAGPAGSSSNSTCDSDVNPKDWTSIRKSFAITSRTVQVLTGEEKPMVYLDHAATTHPSDYVVSRFEHFLRFEYANVHRASYHLARRSTLRFEDAYRMCGAFVGADMDHHCVIFTSNTTAACELVAHTMAERQGKVLLTDLEHHSNDLPYRQRGETIRIGLDSDMQLDMNALRTALREEDIKLVAVTGAANVTGWMPPIHEIAKMAHEAGALICVDGAQLLAHAPFSMGPPGEPESIDFFVAAGHKAYAPFGAGFIVGPRSVFDAAPPVVCGGGVAAQVTTDGTEWLSSPDRHQFGTPNVGGAIALAEMLKLLDAIGMDRIREHEMSLFTRMVEGLRSIGGIQLYGPSDLSQRVGIIPFNVDGQSDMMTAAVLGEEYAVAVRNGRFCSHIHSDRLLENGEHHHGAVRASIGLYNNEDDVDAFLRAVEDVRHGRWQGTYHQQGGQLSGQWGGRCADNWMEAESPSDSL